MRHIRDGGGKAPSGKAREYKETPMMRQYLDIKSQTEDCILFFRLGDFYEMFGEDARLASRELDLTLTTRDRGSEKDDKVPMCGVPYHSAESYIARLIARGYKVAICEQTEDPAAAKTLVRREVTRIITPGTVMDASMLEESRHNFLSSLVFFNDAAGLCFADISTGEVYATQVEGEDIAQRVMGELGRFTPREALLDTTALAHTEITRFLKDRMTCSLEKAEAVQASPPPIDEVPYTGTDVPEALLDAARTVCARFEAESVSALGLRDKPAALMAVDVLLRYLHHTQKGNLRLLGTLNVYTYGKFMELDMVAQKNLELKESLKDGGRTGTLLWVLDETKTPMGSRMLRLWLDNPLVNPVDIGRRLGAVEELLQAPARAGRLTAALAHMSDMERLIGRLVYGTGGGRDATSLGRALSRLPEIKATLTECQAPLLRELSEQLDELQDLCSEIQNSLVDDPPHSIREGGFIREGFHPEVDRLREIVKNGRGLVAAMEASEREKTGIKSLKIGYNKVFGYYVEITKSYFHLVPEHYVRRQTLSNCERFVTEELKEMESTILTAQERVVALEGELFAALRDKLAVNAHRVQRSAHAIAQADVLCGFAAVAGINRYVRPQVDYSERIDITEGRHPVVERMLPGGYFVPNDAHLNPDALVTIITGPNMAGKSTYMRQVALIVLMAQIGSFVPAQAARIGVVDRIFTRIGASDDLAGGRSTFMVEMTEVAEMLRHATSKSLLILDEIGRGTSTFDGMSVARAVLEYVADPRTLGAKTLFSTHYHELTELEETLPQVRNYNIAVKRRGDEMIFLRKIVPGGADDSFGVLVAALAGLPDPVIRRAKEVLAALEATSPKPRRHDGTEAQLSFAQLGAPDASTVLPLDTPPAVASAPVNMGLTKVAERLRAMEPNTLSPLEALGLLFELRSLLND